MTGFGPPPTSSIEAGALRQIDSSTKTFANRDFVKNISWLNQSVDTLSSYTQKLQAGVDSANKNTIDQLQGVLADIFVLFSGGQPTGIDIGDLKYIIEGMGAMLGINPDTPFPLNLMDAAGNLLNQYIIPQQQFTDVIFDSIIAWATELGYTSEAIGAIEEFDDAVVAFYQGMEDTYGELSVMFTTLLKAFGLGSGSTDLTALKGFWEAIQSFMDDITEGPNELLMNVLSAIVSFIFKSMTWVTNTLNPANLLESTGLKFVGPQLVPAVSGSTIDWAVGANQSTTWVFDPNITYNDSAGSFKTLANGTTKRVITQQVTPCTPGDSYFLSAWVKWDSVPVNQDTFGPCVVFYSGANEVTQINANITTGHGATGGWQKVDQVIVVPQNVDGFKVGGRVFMAVNTGTVWIDEISCTAQQSVGEGLAQGILDFPRKSLEGFINDLDNVVVTLFGEGTVLSQILANVIPSLDASKIATGQFTQNMIEGLETAFTNIWLDLNQNIIDLGQLANDLWYRPAEAIGQLSQDMIADLTTTFSNINDWIQNLIDEIVKALTGLLGTNNPIANVVSGFQDLFQKLFGNNVPQNTLKSGAVPALDASKISTGTLGTGLIPNLDADKITSGNLLRSIIGIEDFENLAAGSSFEGISPWIIGLGWSIQTDQFYSGSKSLKKNGATTNGTCTLMGIHGTRSGEQFYAEFYARRDSDWNGTNSNSKLRFGNQFGTYIYQITYGTTELTAANTWTKLSGVFTVPANCFALQITLRSDATAGNLWIDDIVIRRVKTSEVLAAASVTNAKLGTDISGDKIAVGTVAAPRIAALDASKISTGTLGTTLIPSLDAGKITTGSFLDSLIPNLNASKVTAGSFLTSLIPSLDASKVTTGSFGTSLIPNLAATKITSGTFLDTLIPSLNAAKINAGTFLSNLIPGLDVSKIISGTFGGGFITDGAISNTKLGTDISGDKIVAGTVTAARVGALDASKVTSGSFVDSLIPNLAASKITTGTFGSALIPLLDAAKVATGTFLSNLIPGLDGSKITTGTIGTAIVPNLDAGKITTGNFNQSRVTGLVTNLATKNNIVSNPGFENNSLFLGQATYATAPEPVRSGTYSAKFVGTGAGQWARLATTDTSTLRQAAAPGDVIYLECWIYGAETNTVTTSGFYLYAQGYSGSNANVENSHAGRILCSPALNGVWTKWSGYRVLTHADIRSVTLGIYTTCASGEIYYLDDPVVRFVTDANQINKALYTSNVPGAAIISSAVPSLDGSKITSGTIGTSIVPSLDANKITTGSFLSSLIPGLDVSKIVTGIFGAGFIPALDAAKIATGSFLSSLIPALDASKVTTGNFAQSRVTNLSTDLTAIDTKAVVAQSLAATADAKAVTADGKAVAAQSATVRLTTMGSNICPNNSFEDTTFFGSNLFSTEQARSGTRSLKRVATGSHLDYYVINDGTTQIGRIPAAPGDTFYVEFWVYGASHNTGGGTITFYGTAYTSADVTLSWPSLTYSPTTANRDVWTKVSGDVTIPTSATTTAKFGARIRLGSNIPTNGTDPADTYYFDDFIIREVTVANVAKTNAAAAQAQANAATTNAATADAKAVTADGKAVVAQGLSQTAQLSGSNLLSNFGFENTNFFNAAEFSTEQAYQGTRSWKWKVTGANYLSPFNSSSTANGVRFPASSGDSFLFEMYIFPATGNSTPSGSGMTISSYIRFEDKAGNQVHAPGISLDSRTFIKGQWHKVTGIITAATLSTITRGVMQIHFVAGEIDNTFYIDNASLYRITESTSTNVALYNQNTPLSSILTSVVPALDASKISTGTLGTSIVPNLDTAKITTGTFATARLADGAITNVKLGTDISGDKIVAGTVGSARVGALDASKVTTGTFGTSFIPGLDVSKIISGIFGAGFIPNLNASKITAGSFLSSLIPNLDASKVTTGTFGNSLIASGLDAAKLTTGTLPIARIASGAITNAYLGSDINGSKIGAGSVAAARISSLDASKITTGAFPQSQITSLTTDLGNRVDYSAYNAFLSGGASNVCTNPSFEDTTQYLYHGTYNTNLAYVRSGTKSAKLTGTGANRYLALIANKTGEVWFQGAPSQKFYVEYYIMGDPANTQTGTAQAANFRFWLYRADNSYITTSSLSPSLTFDAIGKGTWVKVSGYVTISSNADVAKIRPMLTIHTNVTAGNSFYFDDIFIENVTEVANTNNALFNSNTPLSALLASIVPALDTSKITTGTFANAMIASGLDAAKLTTGTLPIARIAVGAVTNTYIGSDINGSKIGAGTVAASYIAAIDASKVTTGNFAQSRVTNLSTDLFTLNGKIDLIGSGARIYRASTGFLTAAVGRNKFPTTFWDTLESSTSDYTVEIVSSKPTGKITATYAGWYLVEIGFKVNQASWGTWQLAPLLYRNNSVYKVGSDAVASGVTAGARYSQSSFIVYLVAGGYIQAGYDSHCRDFFNNLVTIPNVFTGSAGGIETYCGITLLNRSYA